MSRFVTITFDIGNPGEEVPDDRVNAIAQQLKKFIGAEGGRNVLISKTADDSQNQRVAAKAK